MISTVVHASPVTPAPDIFSSASSTDEQIDDAERARRIRVAVRAESTRLRAAHPLLAHQDLIGASILAVSAVGVICTALAYGVGLAAWWIALPVAAIFMSLAHEVEHDTIHRLYFTRNKRAQSVMFAVCWALRPYTLSPWKRRKLHLLHHEVSGTEFDVEEIGITNGQRWTPWRVICMIDPVAAFVSHLPSDPEARRRSISFIRRAWFPLTFVALTIWYGFIVLALADIATDGSVASAGILGGVAAVIQFLTVTWVGPNVLRGACINFISSNMHYFGDVESGNVVQQTQVLNRWWLAPAQLFCFNFGSTHGIHHFVPNDPFYVRQMTAKVAHEAMREHGVRFNDLGTFRRANRYHLDAAV